VIRRTRNTSLDSVAPLVLGLACTASSCVRVEISYRDVGGPDAYAPDAARPDAARPDAPIDAIESDGSAEDASADAPFASSDAPLPTGDDGTRAVLASVGQRIILDRLVEFERVSESLVSATERAATSGDARDRESARDAWRVVMRSWEELEVVQVGPAGLPLYALGGRALRDEIHPWPLVGFCAMDQDLVTAAYADAALLGAEPVNGRGLPAIEYALFTDDPGNGCAASHPLNTGGAWVALGDSEIARRRLVFAHTAAVVVAQHARELRIAWDPAGEDFLGTFRTAGAGSPIYTTARSALNGLSDALFYLYKEVADYKLGTPAGVYVDCPTATCPDNVESPWSDSSLEHVRVNLEAFRDAYLGAPAPEPGFGFDDLLRGMGASEVDTRMQAAIATAFAAFDPIEGPLETAVDSDHADVVALHDAIRAVANIFRNEVLVLLELMLPNRVEGDND
jgi:predicted lipoprotein